MHRIFTKEIFIKIFQNPVYRQKLDSIILNFFGLEANKKEAITIDKNNNIVLEFMLFINTEYVLTIEIIDTKKIFKSSKKFYLNLSFKNIKKYYQLVLPCYFEIYCFYSYKNLSKIPKILLIAALFSCENIKEIKDILKKLETFSYHEIEDIIEKIEIKK